ncbi:hypothetical protein D3C84_816800 [compost metagenome]
MQRRHFGAAGTAHAPGLFKHAAALYAVTVQALRDVVVAPRGIETGIGLVRRTVEHLRLADGQPHVVGQLQFEQFVVTALHHEQIGTTINLLAMTVCGQVLITAVTQHSAADEALADAVGHHLGQVLLQHHTFGE